MPVIHYHCSLPICRMEQGEICRHVRCLKNSPCLNHFCSIYAPSMPKTYLEMRRNNLLMQITAPPEFMFHKSWHTQHFSLGKSIRILKCVSTVQWYKNYNDRWETVVPYIFFSSDMFIGNSGMLQAPAAWTAKLLELEVWRVELK